MLDCRIAMLGTFHICIRFVHKTMELRGLLIESENISGRPLGLIGIDRIMKKVVFTKTYPNLPFKLGHVIFKDRCNFYFIAYENVNH